MKTKTIDAATGKWLGILVALGVDKKFLVNRHGPCPCCGGRDRYRWDDREGTGSFFCSNCGAGDGISLLMKLYGWSFRQAAMNVDSVIDTVKESEIRCEKSETEKVELIKRVLKQSMVVVKGDPVWLYLNRRTGTDSIPRDIRFHPSLYHSDGSRHPAMLTIMRDSEGNGVSVHRTYLSPDGGKANVSQVKKFMQGRPLNGSSAWLGCIAERIGISEGIETAISASVKFGLPVFAATNANLLESWTPPRAVSSVVIFGDNDSNFTGQSAAYKLANRLCRNGIYVDVKIPEFSDTDWCDVQ